MIEIYSDVCFNCQYRTLDKSIRLLERELSYKIPIRRIDINSKLLERSKQVTDVQVPFIYNTELRIALQLTQSTTYEELRNILV